MVCSNTHTEHPTVTPNTCIKCKKLGDTACDALNPCCDDGSACMFGKCCKPAGASCGSKSECCGTDICVLGKCQSCGKRDVGGCGTAADCCEGEGLECASGVCRKRCVAPTGTCSVEGKKGACAVGTWTCLSEFANPTCTSSVTPKPEGTNCDNIDNDCNGTVDDIAEQPCFEYPKPSGVVCQGTFKAGGTWRCKDGARFCDNGANYCTTCGRLASGESCGLCLSDTCKIGYDSDTGRTPECQPGYTCLVSTPCKATGCAYAPPTCWLPKDNGVCWDWSKGSPP